jgi:hypothetical protein
MASVALFETFQRWRRAKLDPTNENLPKSPAAASLDALAQTLRDEGVTTWLSEPYRIVDAIIKVEQSWTLRKTADTAISLGVMYDLVNRHQDALIIYREAFHLFPEHPRLRLEAGIKLLRHGLSGDIRAFFESVLRFDPSDPFAKMVTEMLDNYPSWVGSLATTIKADKSGRKAYLLTCGVWGEPFTTNFIRYLCATLLSPDNLPALAQHHAVHLAIFTTPENEDRMRADPIIRQVASYASVHFMRYETRWAQYKATMLDRYGPELGPYYGRNCKFLLFSSAHYAALAACRDSDGVVLPLCADMVLDGGALMAISEKIANNDVVAFNGFRVDAAVARATIDDGFRDSSGRVAIPASALARLFIDHMPETYFADSESFTLFPEIVCWRAGRDAVLVHSTHYHPICIRPSALSLPLELSIDPVDSRFFDKRFSDKDRFHLVQDMSVACGSLEESAGFDNKPPDQRPMSVQDIGRWLWQVWGPWRALQFRAPMWISPASLPPEHAEVQQRAHATVAEIIKVSEDLEEGNRGRKSWALR